MVILSGAFAVFVLLTVLVGVAVLSRLFARPRGARWVGEALATRIGPLPAAASILVVGWLLTVAVMFPVGLGCRALAGALDRPVEHWVSARVVGDSHFSKFMAVLTISGNRDVIELLTLVSLLVLGFAYGRRWWLPTIAIIAAFFAQRQGQILLTHLVPRAHPDAPFAGVFPSGGVSRLVAVDGVVIGLVLHLQQPALRRAWQVRAWTGLAVFAVIEAYSRVYLSVHWTTDAFAGLLFGGLLLAVELAAMHALSTSTESRTESRTAGRARTSA